ncbi:MAG TPA: GNAT family N-acetyltransferase [Actinocrinis sp.]|nr:GNAT family N-acetyltransferase [Actinocrinis sp.]
MSAYEIRRFRADEWPQFREIRLEALTDTPIGFAEWYEDAVGLSDEAWQDRTQRAAKAPDSALFAAFTQSGKPVGTAGAFTKTDSSLTDGTEMVIYGVYVSPEHRGPNLGVATLLFDSVIRWARESCGADVLTLSVHERNERAHAFYRRYGFVDTGETMPYNLDETAALIWMRYHG